MAYNTGPSRALALGGVNPTFLSLGAIRHKNRQMKELSDNLFHPRNARFPHECAWTHPWPIPVLHVLPYNSKQN